MKGPDSASKKVFFALLLHLAYYRGSLSSIEDSAHIGIWAGGKATTRSKHGLNPNSQLGS